QDEFDRQYRPTGGSEKWRKIRMSPTIRPSPSEVRLRLLIRLSVLAVMTLGTVVLQYLSGREGLALPWYFLTTLVMGLVPMTWLIYENWRAPKQTWLAFITTSSLFIVASAVAELIAIQWRFWWFYQGIDKLLGVQVGGVPVEEFFFYPLFLNL